MKHTLKTFLLAFVVMMVPIVGWGQTNVSTFYLSVATAIPDGVLAYTVAGVDGDYLDLKQIEGSLILANTPVILAESELPNSGVANASASEYLLGTLVNQSVTIEAGYSYFQLNVEDAIWYKVTEESFVNDAGKAYLKFPDSMVAGKEKLYTIKEDAPQNSCGENLTWTLTDGELVIEGTGAMYNFEDEAAPWFTCKDEIVKLTIKSGVTSVGDYAFNKCDKITDVVISNGVTTLGTHAFGYCEGLTVVSLPPSVKTIGWSAFYACRNLTTVNLSEGVTRIGEYSFADCGNLSKLNIPEGVTEIGQWAFRNCSFTSLILPSTLTAIQSCAFFDCCELTSLTCLATTPPGLWNEAFATLNLSVPINVIYVPSVSVADYESREQWNAFTIKAVCSSESDHNFVNGICTKCGAYEPAVDSNGDGYYEIGNAGQLYWFAAQVNRGSNYINAVLTADIDLENRKWSPIGYYTDDPYVNNCYKGVFDGNNHVIKNLNVHVSDGSEAGLFSRLTNGTLKNLGVINATVQSDHIIGGNSYRAGVLAGEINDAIITNVFSSGALSIVTDHQEKGGIAGECNHSILTNCYTTYGALAATNVRVATNCFYLADEANASSAGTAVTAAQMASGEVAYKLGNAYGQTIGIDAYPVLGGAKVYYGYPSCTDSEKSYSNEELPETPTHNYIDGVCEHCSEVAEARWGTSLANLTQAGTLKEALAAAMSGSANYILMQKDVAGITTNADPYLYITGGDFTLDLNGCSLTCDVYGPNVRGGANLIITDTSANKDGELIGIYGNITVKDATVSILEGTIRDGLMLVHSGGRLNISGGTIATNAIRTNEGAVATISGGTLTNKRLYYSGGKVDLSTYTDLPGIQVRYELDTPTVIGPETILLPDDCGIFDEDGVLTEILSGDLSDYTIAKLPTIWYTVNFDANGGAGEMEDANANGKYRLPECTFTAPEGKMFKAWSVNEVEYQPNAVITVAENTTITAVWATPYTLAFSANGGVGSLVALKTLSTVTLPECPFLAPEGKEFKAWRIGENEYAAGSVATLTEDAVAYAVWNDALVVHELDVVIFPFPDAGEGATVRIMRDGIEIDRVEITVAGEPAHRWIPYDSNHEYTFYWERRLGISSCDVDVEIHLGPERIFREFGHNLEHEYRDRPFLTIPAKASAGSTLETLNIIDGELPEYNVLREAEVGTLTYSRTLPNTEWNALFLPFEIPLSELEADYEVAYFNDMHSYDRNRDGEIDELEMEIILIDEGTLHANHPYFIRATSDDAKDLELVLNDVTICETENAQLTCSSVYTKFDLNGSYAKKSAAELEGCYAISTEGVWAPLADGTALNPFRFYLEITQLAGSPVKVSSHALKSIRIRLNGQGDTTDIQEVPTTTTDAAVYDLSGRRVVNPGKGVYIVNGKKVMMK
ncbi:MAG: leucine-rich repeat protein [Prevotellamassilia sp.]|nr:leucine-rich repeat protein [Prevotellamassilia sp.]